MIISQIESLLSRSDAGDGDAAKTIEKLFGSELRFGTSGLRGPMGPGSSRMNQLVVIQVQFFLFPLVPLIHHRFFTLLEKRQRKGCVLIWRPNSASN